MPASANSMPTTMPNRMLVSRSNAVPSDQCRHMRMPPAAAVTSAATDPPMSHGRQRGGGSSCAQPNQALAKKPKMSAVAAASRTCSVTRASPV